MFFLYIIQCRDGSFYTGTAKDPDTRIHQHNTGKGARYTRGRRPAELVYSEEFETRGEALRREHAVKRMTRKQKMALVKSGQESLNRSKD